LNSAFASYFADQSINVVGNLPSNSVFINRNSQKKAEGVTVNANLTTPGGVAEIRVIYVYCNKLLANVKFQLSITSTALQAFNASPFIIGSANMAYGYSPVTNYRQYALGNYSGINFNIPFNFLTTIVPLAQVLGIAIEYPAIASFNVNLSSTIEFS